MLRDFLRNIAIDTFEETDTLRCFRPRPQYTVFKRKRYCFVPDTTTVHTTTSKTIRESSSITKHSSEWNDLKTVLFENAVFLVWTAKTILLENDDVTATNRLSIQNGGLTLSGGFLVDALGSPFNHVKTKF